MGLDELRQAVEHLHNCSASHSGSAPVIEEFKGQTVWKGQVEIFDVKGHPKATRCYAWEHGIDRGGIKYQAVLELPPVHSPTTAVQSAIVSEFSDGRKES